jgi:glutaredoxin
MPETIEIQIDKIDLARPTPLRLFRKMVFQKEKERSVPMVCVDDIFRVQQDVIRVFTEETGDPYLQTR